MIKIQSVGSRTARGTAATYRPFIVGGSRVTAPTPTDTTSQTAGSVEIPPADTAGVSVGSVEKTPTNTAV